MNYSKRSLVMIWYSICRFHIMGLILFQSHTIGVYAWKINRHDWPRQS